MDEGDYETIRQMIGCQPKNRQRSFHFLFHSPHFFEIFLSMEKFRKYAALIIVIVSFAAPAVADQCAICGKDILGGTAYFMTDDVTGIKQIVCSDCVKLPVCHICGLPVKNNGLALPDGRYLCARDKATAVLTADEAQRVASDVQEHLERLFARYTTFPTNVDVTVLDRIDVDQMFQPGGNDFESPNLLGCTQAKTNGNWKGYSVRLMTGLPLAELEATTAHEFSHVWAGENVPPARRQSLSRDAEEGFCELVAYLLMDSQNEELQKKFILKNAYTRGQVQLFIEGNKLYGFDQILDWMQYGDTPELEPGRLDKIRDVVMPKPGAVSKSPEHKAPVLAVVANNSVGVAARAPETLRVEGIFWSKSPSAIINGHSVFPDDRFKVTIGDKTLHLHCLEIQKNSVLVENTDTGAKEKLGL